MKKIRFPVIVTTLYLLVYVVIAQAGVAVPLVFFMFGLSPLVLIWMVIRVLKDGEPSGKKFDEYFYDDSDYRRE